MSEITTSQYYAERAAAERRRSQAAIDPRAGAAHAELAARYEALASDPSLELPGMGSEDDLETEDELVLPGNFVLPRLALHDREQPMLRDAAG